MAILQEAVAQEVVLVLQWDTQQVAELEVDQAVHLEEVKYTTIFIRIFF